MSPSQEEREQEPRGQPSRPSGAAPPWYRVHLWDVALFRDGAKLALLAAAALLAWSLASLVLPVLAALVLAGVFHPLVSHAQRRWRWPRALGSTLSLLSLLGVLAGTLAVGVPRITTAVADFAADIPRYADALPASIRAPLEDLSPHFDQALPTSLGEAKALWTQARGLVGAAANVTGTVVYALVVLTFCAMVFAYGLTKLDRVGQLRHYLPEASRERFWALLERYSQILVGFVRGQLAVAGFTTTGFAIGFSVIGVPHALVVALIGGGLSFIPNGQASGWLLAMLLTGLEELSTSAFDWASVLLWPSCVYAVTQSLEAFVITPWVQGSFTRLHPLAVLGALLAGGTLGGVMGMLVAIPAAAGLKLMVTSVLGHTPESQRDGRRARLRARTQTRLPGSPRAQ